MRAARASEPRERPPAHGCGRGARRPVRWLVNIRKLIYDIRISKSDLRTLTDDTCITEQQPRGRLQAVLDGKAELCSTHCSRDVYSNKGVSSKNQLRKRKEVITVKD